MAGGDCIDDADCSSGRRPAPWAARSRRHPPGLLRRASELLSRELLARAWAAGAGHPAAPFTIDDSTICGHGLAKEGARHHGYTGKRGYHPSPPAGDVLIGPTPPAAPPTSCGRRWDGCATPGPADDSRYGTTAGTHGVYPSMDGIGPSAAQGLRNLIEARGWTPIPCGRRRMRTTCTPPRA